jgi:hypothetical protein
MNTYEILLIPKSMISEAQIKALRIRIKFSITFKGSVTRDYYFPDCPESLHPSKALVKDTEFWAVALSTSAKLGDHYRVATLNFNHIFGGYDSLIVNRSRFEPALPEDVRQAYYCVLMTRDGSAAVAGVDPSSVKLVMVDNVSNYKLDKSVFKPLLDKASKDITIKVPHNATQRPLNNAAAADIKIYFWATPPTILRDDADDSSDDEALYKDFGEPLTGLCDELGVNSDDICYDSLDYPVSIPLGYKTLTYKEHVLGCYNSANIYFFWDACHTGSEAEHAVVTYFIKQIVDNYDDLINATAISIDDAKTAYINAVMRRITKSADIKANRIKEIKERVENLQQQLVDTIREGRQIELEEDVDIKELTKYKDKFGKEFDRLKRNPKIIGLEISDSSIQVMTTVLNVVDPRTKKEHELGKFHITIDSKNGIPSFINLTRRVKGMQANMHAPHVWSAGNACLGSLNSSLPKLITSYEWATAVELCIAFLESVNTDDPAGRKVNKWPLSPAQKIKDRASRIETEVTTTPVATEQVEA